MFFCWRRDRDLNPGHLSVLQFSRLLASATRAPRHVQLDTEYPHRDLNPDPRSDMPPRPTAMRPGVRASCSKPPTRPVSTSYPRVSHGSTVRGYCSRESRCASRIILVAAFKSLSCQTPQTGHDQLRTLKSFVAPSRCPQFEHIWLDGNHLSTTMSCLPCRSSLLASMERNNP